MSGEKIILGYAYDPNPEKVKAYGKEFKKRGIDEARQFLDSKKTQRYSLSQLYVAIDRDDLDFSVEVFSVRHLGPGKKGSAVRGKIENMGAVIIVIETEPAPKKKEVGRPEEFKPDAATEKMLKDLWLDPAELTAEAIAAMASREVGHTVTRQTLHRRWGPRGGDGTKPLRKKKTDN